MTSLRADKAFLFVAMPIQVATLRSNCHAQQIVMLENELLDSNTNQKLCKTYNMLLYLCVVQLISPMHFQDSGK